MTSTTQRVIGPRHVRTGKREQVAPFSRVFESVCNSCVCARNADLASKPPIIACQSYRSVRSANCTVDLQKRKLFGRRRRKSAVGEKKIPAWLPRHEPVGASSKSPSKFGLRKVTGVNDKNNSFGDVGRLPNAIITPMITHGQMVRDIFWGREWKMKRRTA